MKQTQEKVQVTCKACYTEFKSQGVSASICPNCGTPN